MKLYYQYTDESFWALLPAQKKRKRFNMCRKDLIIHDKIIKLVYNILMNLSKSRYCKGVQCPKILWLDEHKSEERDESVLNQNVFDTGNKVGDLAMQYFGDFTEVCYSDDKNKMLNETKRLLEEKTRIICEASFSYKGSFCSVDILHNCENSADNLYEIIEVKSTTNVKPNHIDDMAFQYYVLTSCGLNITKISLMHINNEYVLKDEGALDIQNYFKIQDCTEDVLSKQNDITAKIEQFKNYAAQENEPVMDIGAQCYVPYECVYRSFCWQHIPKESIFSISGKAMRLDKKFGFYKRGIITIEQLLKSGEDLNESARIQSETLFYNRPPTIDKEAIRAFLNTLNYPLYYLDFETMQEAIPLYKGMRPFIQTPFQYSLHIQKSKGAELEHKEFLAEEGKDPRRSLAERLCADIPKDVCILAYNMNFEKGRIKELSEYLNDLSAHLMNLHDNFKDLMLPFQTFAYYSNELCGSYSIKKVLPALCSDDPELNYNVLDLIHNGGEAQVSYAQLTNNNVSTEEKQRIKKALLAYCRLDTLAMVKILEKLYLLSA